MRVCQCGITAGSQFCIKHMCFEVPSNIAKYECGIVFAISLQSHHNLQRCGLTHKSQCGMREASMRDLDRKLKGQCGIPEVVQSWKMAPQKSQCGMRSCTQKVKIGFSRNVGGLLNILNKSMRDAMDLFSINAGCERQETPPPNSPNSLPVGVLAVLIRGRCISPHSGGK